MDPAFCKKVEKIVGREWFTTLPEDLIAYGYDANDKAKALPEAVVSPQTVDQVSAVVKLANEYKVPLTPRGGGSGYTGGCVPIYGGLVMVMERFNKILEIDTDNYLAIVEPGVIVTDLQEAVAKKGLMYPPDPASAGFATIGGNIAENAGGIRALKYGVTKQYVMALELVLPTGEIVKTGSKCIKDVVGYNLTELFVGSEGTLGIITKAVMKLVPEPESRRTMTATFATLEDAALGVRAIYGTAVRPSTLEFLDTIALKAVVKAIDFEATAEEGALLLIEVDGHEHALDEEVAKIEAACKQCRVINFKKATTSNEREDLWKARRFVNFALTEIASEWEDDDISVPIGRIPEMVRRLNDIAKKYDIIVANYGHYGDGNLHMGLTTGKGGRPFPKEALTEVTQAVTDLEGRIAAEHGIGCVKASKLHWNIDEPTIAMMRRMKRLFDPNGIFNIGKVMEKQGD